MHFILLGIGVLLGIIGLYRFFMNASIKQISAAFMVAGFFVICIALFYLAVTGKLPAAIGLVAALWPLALSWYHNKKKQAEAPPHAEDQKRARKHKDLENMSHAEALDVLGLADNATDEQVKQAHKRLMKKVHPDQEGSAWMAQKLNQARDVLLDK